MYSCLCERQYAVIFNANESKANHLQQIDLFNENLVFTNHKISCTKFIYRGIKFFTENVNVLCNL